METYRFTYCPKTFTGNCWGFQLVDVSQETFRCIHCHEQHSVKDYVKKDENDR